MSIRGKYNKTQYPQRKSHWLYSRGSQSQRKWRRTRPQLLSQGRRGLHSHLRTHNQEQESGREVPSPRVCRLLLHPVIHQPIQPSIVVLSQVINFIDFISMSSIGRQLSEYLLRINHYETMVERLRQKIAENHYFQPETVFERMDKFKKGYLIPDDMA